MKLFKNKHTLTIRFDKDEEVMQKLGKFIIEEKITSGYFAIIGSTKEVILSYYNLKSKQFEDHPIEEDLEVVSVTGNIAWMNETPVIHAHGVFSRSDLSTLGGHIKKLVVSATCEVMLTIDDTTVTRTHDVETGLNLLS